ncbi:MAG TPA: N-acetylneuraminate synthase family protein [Candidatus Paceibacterota bacterium]|nr:N-acetylneuraminate synthase family protein [Candidatus Paceibacterota bacterium]
MKIADKLIGPGQPCFITSEIGINANGSVEIAKKMIDAAVAAGANAVKFQKRSIEVCYSKEELDKPRESPWGTTNRQQKEGLEFGLNEYLEIDDYCAEKGIIWFASPWDNESAEFLDSFDVPVWKVASACVTDIELLRYMAESKKPVIISTGMSTLKEVESAVYVFRTAGYSNSDIALLSCVSTYPTPINELNLLKIVTLKDYFKGHPVGYSGHEVGVWTTLAAVAMGACIVERHLTLDRASYGSDQAASLEPIAFAKLILEIRDLERARGDGKIDIIKSEIPVREKLRRFK